jgi:hypothetical protein
MQDDAELRVLYVPARHSEQTAFWLGLHVPPWEKPGWHVWQGRQCVACRPVWYRPAAQTVQSSALVDSLKDPAEQPVHTRFASGRQSPAW